MARFWLMYIVLGYCPCFQSEFRCGHSTTTALVRVIEDLKSSMTKGRVTVPFLLEFGKAFDCVDYRLFSPSLSRRLIFMDRQGIWCPHF
jgi:hypothetical protein